MTQGLREIHAVHFALSIPALQHFSEGRNCSKPPIKSSSEAGIAKVPKDSEACYLMGISMAKSSLQAANIKEQKFRQLD